jgi:hypothetical protein
MITKDKVDKLISKNGFHLKENGRTGAIYYVNNKRICEFEYELSGVNEFDFFIYFDSLNNWLFPIIQPINGEEKKQIKVELQQWLQKKKIKAEF